METLGIRNNNPCNIRYNSVTKWKGQVGHCKGFCKFSTMDMGVRAVLSLLRTYFYHYNLDTIRKIITRFAPSSENDTESYINFVVNLFHDYGVKSVTADSPLVLDFYDYKGFSHLFYLVRAMCIIESKFFLEPLQFSRCLKLLHV